jgi:acyl-coenzyme A thioesterase PaaI-like protein
MIMQVTNIPFAKHIGIERKEEGTLKLEATDVVQNHIQTIHASAQFALAETQSGLYLQILFPEYKDQVIPLLRGSTVKYKQPATKEIYAVASVDEKSREKFLALFEKKGRASITVMVELRDVDDLITMQGEFTWFMQKLS